MGTAIIKKAFLGVSLATIAAVTALAGTLPATASATSCRRTDIGLGNQTARFGGDETLDWWRSDTLTTQSSSGCSSIYITNVVVPGDSTNDYTCVYFRARFYPTSGGSSVTPWKLFCTGTAWNTLASNVLNGTTYCIEAMAASNINYRPYYTIYD